MKQKTTRVSALLPTTLVDEVRRYSNSEQVTQSLVIQRALESWVKVKLNRDTKDLAKINFDDLPDENDWLNIQSTV